MNDLSTFFTKYPKVAIAFSGGVDSAYLLAEAVRLGAEAKAYYVKSQFQPAWELEDAERLTMGIGARLEVLSANMEEAPDIMANPTDRCYVCKRKLFGLILDAAARDGFPVVLDGTNASDLAEDRPGMRALAEMQVLSPLRLCGLTKAEIRRRSREVGLFTWNKPAYACLATRIPTGTEITEDLLKKVEAAEMALQALGFRDFRVRWFHGAARIQLPAEQLLQAAEAEMRQKIIEQISPYFEPVLLDLQARPSQDKDAWIDKIEKGRRDGKI